MLLKAYFENKADKFLQRYSEVINAMYLQYKVPGYTAA
jgi:hypothetical protein